MTSSDNANSKPNSKVLLITNAGIGRNIQDFSDVQKALLHASIVD